MLEYYLDDCVGVSGHNLVIMSWFWLRTRGNPQWSDFLAFGSTNSRFVFPFLTLYDLLLLIDFWNAYFTCQMP